MIHKIRGSLKATLGISSLPKAVQIVCQHLKTLDVQQAFGYVTELIADGSMQYSTVPVVVFDEAGAPLHKDKSVCWMSGVSNGYGLVGGHESERVQRELSETGGDNSETLDTSLAHASGMVFTLDTGLMNALSGVSTSTKRAMVEAGIIGFDFIHTVRQLKAQGLESWLSVKKKEARRSRIHSATAGGIEGGKALRNAMVFAHKSVADSCHTSYNTDIIGRECDLTLDSSKKVLAAGSQFFETWEDESKWGKVKHPFPHFMGAQAIIQMANGDPTGYILFQDAVCSGFQGAGMQFGCPQLCALTNLGSKSIGDLYNVIGNGARPYFEDLFNQYPVLVDPFSSRENDKWFTLRIGYGAAASGLCKGLLLKDTAREAGVTLLDEFGCITPMAAKMLSAPVGRRSWINPDFAQVFQSIAQESNWDMVYRIAKLISDGYSKSTFNVSSILRQGTSMGKECVEAAEESDEGMISWVNGSGQTYYGFAPEPDYEKGDDGKYITPSIRLRQKVNGVSVQVTMRPLYNAYSASMLGPDRMHDCFDSVVVNNGNCIFAGMFLNNATIHDALGMGVNDTIIGKAVWQGVYVVCNDELPASFEALIEKYGVQDVRTGSHPWPGEQIRLSEGFIQ